MSLDVWLKSNEKTKAECYSCGHEYEVSETLFDANITHNLATMAAEAKIYDLLWRPNEIGIKTAGELIGPLQAGLKDMKAGAEHYKQFDAKNGWGTYDQFVPWIEKYLNACIEYPDAEIGVSC